MHLIAQRGGELPVPGGVTRLDRALNNLIQWKVSQPITGGLELDDLEGPFQLKPIYGSMSFPFSAHGVKHCQGSSKAVQQQSSTLPVPAAVHKPGKPAVKRKCKGQEQELLEVETSGFRQKGGCKEWRGCRRLFGTDKKNSSETENRRCKFPLHLPHDCILLLRGKNNSDFE